MIRSHPSYQRRSAAQGAVAADGDFVWNWAHDSRLGRVSQLLQPTTEGELQRALAAHRGKVRVVGSRLSSGQLLRVSGEDDLLLDMTAYTGLLEFDDDSATFAGGTPLNEVYATLIEMNRTLLSSPGVIGLQTLAGALSTGSHGQGLSQGSLADDAVAFRLVLADGSLRTLALGDADFPAAQVALGALGVITAITLRTVPARVFTCHKSTVAAQRLSQDLVRWNQEFEFTKAWWYLEDDLVHVWNAQQATSELTDEYNRKGRNAFEHGARDQSLNGAINGMVGRMLPDNDRLDHPRGEQSRTLTRFCDFADITGDVYEIFCRGIAVPQINIELGVPLERAPSIVTAIRQSYRQHRPWMHYPIILRCTGPSSAWLSPAHQRPTCFFGFVVYYGDDGSLPREGLAFIHEMETILAAEGGRPHWGKHYNSAHYNWKDLYPHWDSFWAVRDRYDPHRVLNNDHLGTLHP